MIKEEEKILTKHPTGKNGVNMPKKKYDTIRKSILDSLDKNEMSYSNIAQAAKDGLVNSFQGSTEWYVEVVKLDLEARKLIERIPNTKPQLYKLIR